MFLATIGSLKIDIKRVLTDTLCFLNYILYQRLQTIHPSERVSKSSHLQFAHCLAQSSTESVRLLGLCLQIRDLGSRYLGSLANTYSREVVVNVKVTIYSVATPIIYEYMNGEHAQLHLGDLYLNIDRRHFLGAKYCC